MKLEKHDINCKVCEIKSIVLTDPDDGVQNLYCPICSSIIDDDNEYIEE